MQPGGQHQATPRDRTTARDGPLRRRAATTGARRKPPEPEVTGPAILLGVEAVIPDAVLLDAPDRIDAALLARLSPTRVICPLFAAEYDALTVAQRLSRLGYTGLLLVVAPDLPNPRMVEKEIRNQSGGIEVRVISRP